MAQRTVITVTCDMEHKSKEGEVEGTETLTFALDGSAYEIDVCNPHAKEVREGFGPYIEHSRRVAGTRTARRGRNSATRERSGDIRAWAKANGLTVSDRGRIPASVVEQYDAAN